MSETGSETNELTVNQLRNILNHDHIRQHLIQTGYIDRQGDVIRKTDRSQRPKTSQTRQSHPFLHQNSSNNNSRLKSASSSQTRRTSKTKNSTRFSRINQSPIIHNVLLRRAVSPKLLYPDERCLVTLKYIGPNLNIDYDRDYFEPDGDEVLLLQQHCGGENSPVVKGFFRPNDTFTFASRRHTDYPFAFAFYLNGVIKDRLSVCCESRCQNYTPVGGKKALIAIVKVENARACRRCRYEQRIRKLMESGNSPTKENFIKKNIERAALSSKSSPARPSGQSKVSQKPSPIDDDQHHSSSKSSTSESSPPPIPKRSPTNNKSNSSHKRTQKISSPQEISSGSSSPEPPAANTKKSPTNNKPNFSHRRTAEISSPREISSDDSSSPPPPPRPPPAAAAIPKTSSPQPISSGTSTPERNTSNKASSPPLTVINGKPPGSPLNYTSSFNQNHSSDEEQKQMNHFSSVNNNNNGTTSSQSTVINDQKPIYSDSSKNKPQNQIQRSSNPPHISSEDGSDGDVVSIPDESPPSTNRYSHANTHQRNSFSD